MSTTPLQITTDSSKVLERIEQKIDSVQGNVSDLKVGQAKLENDFKIGQAKLENDLTAFKVEIKGEIKALGDKVVAVETKLEKTETNLNKRLDDTNANLNKRLDDTNSQIVQIQTKINGQTNWFIGIFSILVTGLLGILSKIAFFPNP